MKRILFLIAAHAGIIMMVMGIYGRELGEILKNAKLICLSCIGIG